MILEQSLRSAELRTVCELLRRQLEALCANRRIETVLQSMPERIRTLDTEVDDGPEKWQELADKISACQEKLSMEIAKLAAIQPSSHHDALAYELYREHVMGLAILQILEAVFPVLDQIKKSLITYAPKPA